MPRRGGGPKGRGGKKQPQPLKRFTEKDFNDEIDDFASARDKVDFDKREENDDDSDIEGVLDLDVDEEDDEEEDGEDGEVDSEDEDLAYTPVPGQRKKFIDEDDEEEEEVDESKWGKKRDYYFTDFVDDELGDSEDEEDAQNEEEEVKRMQERRAQEVSEDDYDDTFGGILSKIKAAKKDEKPKTKRSDTVLLESMNKDLEAIDLHNTETGVSVERVSKDIAGLSREERLEIISNESPEFTILLSEFGKSLKEIQSKLQPIINTGKQLPKSNGLIYLQLKYQLLMNYSTNIAFYLMMKAAGKRVKDHPVIDQLFRTKALIDKLAPMDKKVKDQARLLLELIKNGPEGDEQSTSDVEPKAKPTKAADKYELTNGKANGKVNHKKAVQTELSSASEENGDSDGEPEPQSAEPSSEDKFVRYKVKDTKSVKKTSEFTPLEDAGDIQAMDRLTGKKRTYAALMNQLEQNENKKKVVVGGDDDIPYKAGLKKRKLNDGSAKEPEETFISYLHEDDGKSKKAKKGQTDKNAGPDDADVFSDYSDEDVDGLGSGSADGAEDEVSDNEDAFYKSVKSAQVKQKQQKQEIEQQRREAAERVLYSNDMVREGQKRKINYAIKKNKGLAKKAKKENRNSRVKLRNKYAKALTRRTGQVAGVRDQKKPYGGEVGGIKTNVVRSTKLVA